MPILIIVTIVIYKGRILKSIQIIVTNFMELYVRNVGDVMEINKKIHVNWHVCLWKKLIRIYKIMFVYE